MEINVKYPEILKNWLSYINSEWKNYYTSNRFKLLLETNERTVDFFEDLTFFNIEYEQWENGLISESYTVKQFTLVIKSLGIEVRMGSFKIWESSEWVIDHYLEPISDIEGKYELKSETGNTFESKYQLSPGDDDSIQRVFEEFNLFGHCLFYETAYFEKEKQEMINCLKNFFNSNQVDIQYSSRNLVFVGQNGEKRELLLSPERYINHFE